MQTIRGTNQEGSKSRTDEDKKDLQNKTGTKLDSRQGGQDHKTQKILGKTLNPDMAGPDHDLWRFCGSP